MVNSCARQPATKSQFPMISYNINTSQGEAAKRICTYNQVAGQNSTESFQQSCKTISNEVTQATSIKSSSLAECNHLLLHI